MSWVLLIYAVILTIGSLQPLRPGLPHFGSLHRVLHIVCFAALAAMSSVGFKNRKRLVLVALECVAYGGALEFAQHLIYSNRFEWEDLRDDSIGVVAGVFMLILWTARIK